MKPTNILNSGRKAFYLDLEGEVIHIGDTLLVHANSGSNYGAVKKVEGVLEGIDDYGNFIIGGEKLKVERNVLFNKSTSDEIWFKCYEHNKNGFIYSVKKLR